MKRLAGIVVVAALAVCFGVPALHAASSPVPVTRVAIVLAPYLNWDDLDSGHAPFLKGAVERGAVGALNTRNRNRIAGPATSEQGALTLSAGTWAAEDLLAPTAYSVDEYYEGGTAAEAFERMTGVAALDSEIVFLGMPRTQRLNATSGTLDVQVGALGGAIIDQGGVTAAVGNSDSGYEVRGMWRSRPAAIVAMDRDGTVPLGDVSSGLVKSDPLAPYGISADRDAYAEVLARLDAELDAHGGPALVVLDPGDLQRAELFAPDAAPQVAQDHHAAAVQSLDMVARMAFDLVGEEGVLFVVPHVASTDARKIMGLAPAIAIGPGFTGNLVSSSTQRTGLVTDMDITATALDVLGVKRPVSLLGNPVNGDGATTPANERIGALATMNDVARSVDGAKPGVLNTYIAFTTIALLISTVVVLRTHRWSSHAVSIITRILQACLLVVLAVPIATNLMFALDGSPTSAGQAVSSFVLITVALFLFALFLMYRTAARVPVAALSLITVATLAVDQWIGTPWSFSSFLGYSPLLGARYYGMGNEGAALFVGATLIGTGMLFDEYPSSRLTLLGRRWALPLLGLLVVITAAAPFLGANVGVAAWGIVAFAVAWAQMNGVRVRFRTMLLMLLAIVALVAVFSIVDLSSDSGTQTHLGRAWASAASGGAGELWLIIARKAETNVRVLTRTNWSYLLIAVLAFLGFMRWRPQGDFAATLDENPYFSAALSASLIGGFVGYLTEDSGIVIPALILLYGGAGILYLMLGRARGLAIAAGKEAAA